MVTSGWFSLPCSNNVNSLLNSYNYFCINYVKWFVSLIEWVSEMMWSEYTSLRPTDQNIILTIIVNSGGWTIT